MSNFKIVVLDGFSVSQNDLEWNALSDIGDAKIFDRSDAQNKIQRCADADAVLTNKVVFDGSDFDRLPRLKYIGVLATGYNNIDINAARSHSVAVTNIPAYSPDSVAQLVFAHILNIANSVSKISAEIHSGAWVKSPDFCFCPYPQIELAGRNMGIIGYGSIGRRVARIAAAFGMKVSVFSPSGRVGDCDGVANFKTLDEVLSSSDIISLNCVLNESTRNMVSAPSITKMKDGVWIVNAGRGQLIDESDLAGALNSGKVGAAAVDVLSQEPPTAGNPLLGARNCHITGHIAWMTRAARTRLMDIAVANLRAWRNGAPQNLIA